MEKQYIATWGVKGLPMMATVVRIAYPPHDEPKGSTLQDLAVEDIYTQTPTLGSPDVIDIYSVVELQNHVWCQGQTREVVVGGRACALESGSDGWRIHI